VFCKMWIKARKLEGRDLGGGGMLGSPHTHFCAGPHNGHRCHITPSHVCNLLVEAGYQVDGNIVHHGRAQASDVSD